MIEKVSSGIESYIQQSSRTVLETKLIDQRIVDKQLSEKATQSVSVEISQKARSMVKQDLIDDKLAYSKFQDGSLKDAILQQKINSSRTNI
ncbi:hypothetical protein OAN58_02975 [Paracoccaceae bacterium]|nr:hypothetical protein [Paracoccaceae bacterium]MDC0499817.1 hypothetical protein [Paracoccaceae bacterium]